MSDESSHINIHLIEKPTFHVFNEFKNSLKKPLCLGFLKILFWPFILFIVDTLITQYSFGISYGSSDLSKLILCLASVGIFTASINYFFNAKSLKFSLGWREIDSAYIPLGFFIFYSLPFVFLYLLFGKFDVFEINYLNTTLFLIILITILSPFLMLTLSLTALGCTFRGKILFIINLGLRLYSKVFVISVFVYFPLYTNYFHIITNELPFYIKFGMQMCVFYALGVGAAYMASLLKSSTKTKE